MSKCPKKEGNVRFKKSEEILLSNAFGSVTYIKPKTKSPSSSSSSPSRKCSVKSQSKTCEPQQCCATNPSARNAKNDEPACVCKNSKLQKPLCVTDQQNETSAYQRNTKPETSDVCPEPKKCGANITPCQSTLTGSITYIKPESVTYPQISVLYEKEKGGTRSTQPSDKKAYSIDLDEAVRRIEERRRQRGCSCAKPDLADLPRPNTPSSAKITTGVTCSCKINAMSTTSVPISLKFQRSDRDCNKYLREIVLPELKIDVGPERLQTIQIDVKPTDLDSKSSGIITIPVQLRFRKCCEMGEDESTLAEEEAKKKPPRTEKLLFEECAKKHCFENYMEQLLEEFPETDSKEVKPEENFADLGSYDRLQALNLISTMSLEELESDSEYSKVRFSELKPPPEKPEIAEIPEEPEESTKPKTEIIGMRGTPWYEAIDNENYIESYLVEGYCASTDDVEVQTDLVLGDKLLSTSLNSVTAEKPEVAGCKCGIKEVKASETIEWDELILPPKGAISIIAGKTPQILVDIENLVLEPRKMFSEPPDLNTSLPARMNARQSPPKSPQNQSDSKIPTQPELQQDQRPNEKKKKKKCAISPCCKKKKKVTVEPPAYIPATPPQPSSPQYPSIILPDLLPPLVHIPKRYSFVYNKNCSEHEPYLQALSREIKLKENASTSGQQKMPWSRLLLPNIHKIQIRKLEKLVIMKKTGYSSSAPCCCEPNDFKLETDDKSYSTTDVNNTTNNYTALGALAPCPYLNKSETTSLGNNSLKTKMYKDKSAFNKNFTVKARLGSCCCNSKGKMATKITFKTGEAGIDAIDISPVSSKLVTCQYINKDLKYSPENSKPDLISCNKSTCQYKKPSINLKGDPVVAAFHACEAELKPMREALSAVQRKLRNLNMPELDCIFKKDQYEDNPPISTTRPMMQARHSCQCAAAYKPPNRISYQPNQYYQSTLRRDFSESSSSGTRQCPVLKRNKAIQKTGSMYKTNIKRPKPPVYSSEESSNSMSDYSEDYYTPCCATSAKVGTSSKRKDRRIKSQISMTKVTESMYPFIEAIKSILTMDNANGSVCRSTQGKNISYDANLMTKQKKKMRVHMRIRPSRSSKRKKCDD